MIEVFLLVIGLIWIFIASIQDIRKREVYNWLSFSLITIALVFRILYSIINNDFNFLLYGVIGLVIFIILGYGFYYSRIFAGGDAKLLMPIGLLLPYNNSSSLFMLLVFIFLMFASGAIYGIIYSIILSINNRQRFSKEFIIQFKVHKNWLFIGIIVGLISLIIPMLFLGGILFLIPIFIPFIILLYIYAKAVENSSMIKEIKGNEITIGDWLYEKVKIGNNTIEPNWEGVNEEEIKQLKKMNKIKIKYGIPFVPAIFIAFVLLIIFGEKILSYLYLIF